MCKNIINAHIGICIKPRSSVKENKVFIPTSYSEESIFLSSKYFDLGAERVDTSD